MCRTVKLLASALPARAAVRPAAPAWGLFLWKVRPGQIKIAIEVEALRVSFEAQLYSIANAD